MKILSSFDTKKDEKILLKILEEFGNEHSFMIKRHWMYLYKMAWFWFMVLFFLVALFITLSYLLTPTWLLIIVILNLLWIGIWLVITFYQLAKYLHQYNYLINEISEKDLEDWLLEKYLKFSFFLFWYQIIISIITIFLSFNLNNGSFLNIMLNILQIILSILFLYFIWKTIYVLINFEMDFVIITPKYINTYDQSWLFKRNTKTIGVEKIKSIQTNKKWIIRSIFNFWEIVILTEWDEEGRWEIKLNYIPFPDKVKQKIVTIMNVE